MALKNSLLWAARASRLGAWTSLAEVGKTGPTERVGAAQHPLGQGGLEQEHVARTHATGSPSQGPQEQEANKTGPTERVGTAQHPPYQGGQEREQVARTHATESVSPAQNEQTLPTATLESPTANLTRKSARIAVAREKSTHREGPRARGAKAKGPAAAKQKVTQVGSTSSQEGKGKKRHRKQRIHRNQEPAYEDPAYKMQADEGADRGETIMGVVNADHLNPDKWVSFCCNMMEAKAKLWAVTEHKDSDWQGLDTRRYTPVFNDCGITRQGDERGGVGWCIETEALERGEFIEYDGPGESENLKWLMRPEKGMPSYYGALYLPWGSSGGVTVAEAEAIKS